MKKFLILIILLLSPMFALAEDRTARALVSATEKVSISSEISARVEKINFLLGDAFKKGDVLISFDCELYKAQNEVIKANYETAKIQLENDKKLLEMRSIGKLQYQLSVSAMNKAKAELKISTLNVKRCKVIAPYDGKVMDVYTSIFSTIQERQNLMDIVGDGLLEAEIIVPSAWLKWLKTDHNVEIQIDETGDTLKAKIISFGDMVKSILHTINKKRFVVEMPMPIAKIQSAITDLLPFPPILTKDQCEILSEADNVVSNNHLTLKDLDINPADIEEAMKKWLWRYKDGGQFAKVQ